MLGALACGSARLTANMIDRKPQAAEAGAFVLRCGLNERTPREPPPVRSGYDGLNIPWWNGGQIPYLGKPRQANCRTCCLPANWCCHCIYRRVQCFSYRSFSGMIACNKENEAAPGRGSQGRFLDVQT
jgi:hypothetical protein